MANTNGGPLEFEATIDGSQFRAQLNRIEKDLGRVTRSTIESSKQIDTWAKRAATAAAGFFSIQAATGFINQMVKVRGEFQQLEVAFTTILKSRAKADELMKDVIDLAAATPFTMSEVATGAKQLLAYGFAAQSVTNNIEMLGNVAAGVSAPLGDIVYLYGTLQTQGRAYTKDIMQFTNRGIPIIGELAKQFGVTSAEVQKLVEAGKVGFPEIEKAFQSLTGSTGIFYNLMREQSKTLTGLLSNLSDAFQRMLNDLGKSQEGIIADTIKSLITLTENYEKVLDILTILVAAYGAYRAALIAEVALKNAAIINTGKWTAAEILHFNVLRMQEAMLKTRNALMAAAPVAAFTGAIAALGLAIYSVTKVSDAHDAAQKKMNASMQEGNAAARDESQRVGQLIEVIKDKTATLEQQKAAYDKLQSTTGGMLKSLTQEDIALGKGKDTLDEYIKKIREAAAARKAFSDFNEMADQLDELKEKGIDAVSRMDRLGRSLKNTFTPTSQGMSMKDWAKGLFSNKSASEQIVKQEMDVLTTGMDALKKQYNKKWNEIVSGVEDGTVTTVKRSKNSEQAIQDKIDALTEERKLLDVNSAAYKKYTADIEALQKKLRDAQGKTTKEERKSANEKLRVLEQIKQAQAEAFEEGLTQNQKEVAEARRKYKELREEAKNANLGSAMQVKIDFIEQKRVGDIEYKQDTDKLQEELDRQKTIFEGFEQYKRTFGAEMAEQRYSDEKKQFDSFGDYIQSEIAKIMVFQIPGVEMTGPMQERLKMLLELMRDWQQDQKSIRDADYEEAYKAAQTFGQKLAEIEADTNKKIKDLRAGPQTAETDNQIKVLLDDKKKRIEIAKDEAFQKTAIYREINEQIIFYTKEQLKASILAVREMLENAKNMPAELRAQLEGELSRLSGLLNQNQNDGFETQLKRRKALILDALRTEEMGTEEYRNQLQALKEVNAELAKSTAAKFEKIAEVLGAVSGMFSELSSSIGSLNPGLADTLNTMGQIASVGANAAGAIAAFASGNIVGGIAKTVNVIGGVVKLFKEAKESAKRAREELEKWKLEQFLGEFEVNQLYRERLRIAVEINKTKLQGMHDESRLLKEQAKQVQSDYQKVLAELQKETFVAGQKTEKYGGFLGIGRKTRVVNILGSLTGKTYEELEEMFIKGQLDGRAKELFQTLQKLREEGADIDAELAKLKQSAQEIFTGTTSDAITEVIVQGIMNGKRAFGEFADDVEGLIRGALLNALRYQVLEEPIKKLYEQFAIDAEDGLDASEIAKFTESLNKTIEDAAKFAEEVEKATGVSLGKAQDANSGQPEKKDPGTLKGAFEGMSGQQADILAGQMGGQRIAMMQILDETKRQTTVLMTHGDSLRQIEIHTRISSERLIAIDRTMNAQIEELKDLNRKLAAPGQANSANGI